MGATKSIIGFGTLLKKGDGGTPVELFTSIAELFKIAGPKIKRDTHDATNMESPSGYKEFIGGLLDGGEVSFEGNYIPTDATHGDATGLLSEFASASVKAKNWQIVAPNADGTHTTFAFSAIVTDFEPDYPMDNKITLTGTLKISGKPTVTIA